MECRHLRSYTINNVKVDLKLEIEITNTSVGTSFNLKIPLPDNYPNTELSNSPAVINKGLFYSYFIIRNNSKENRVWLDNFKKVKSILKIKASKYITLGGYFITSKLEYNDIKETSEETSMLRGIGKRSICIVMNYLNSDFLSANDTIIMLEASGGSTNRPEDINRINEYSKLSFNKVLSLYREKYPEAYARLQTSDLKNMEEDGPAGIATLLVSTDNNKKLVEYYTKTFGFTQIGYDSDDTLMGTSLSNFISHCSKTDFGLSIACNSDIIDIIINDISNRHLNETQLSMILNYL